jgi:hypothetical protein
MLSTIVRILFSIMENEVAALRQKIILCQGLLREATDPALRAALQDLIAMLREKIALSNALELSRRRQ